MVTNVTRRASGEDYGTQVNFTIWLLTAISATFLGLRVYCKFLRRRGLWWDDYILIASWLCLATSCGFVSAVVALGFGRPLQDFDDGLLVPFLLCSNVAGTFSILAALWSKTSFAVTVLRISDGWTRRFVWFVIVSVNAALGLSIAFTWGQCMPLRKVYTPNVAGTCWPKELPIRYNIFTAAYSGAMDVVLALVPWKIIWTLTMNKKEKSGVLVAMSMGIFAGITSITKVATLPGIADSDFTDATTQLIMLGAAASIPVLRALVCRHLRPPTPATPAEFYRDFGSCAGEGTERGEEDVSGAKRGSRTSAVHDQPASSGASAVSEWAQQSVDTWPLCPVEGILTSEEVDVEYEKAGDAEIGRAF